MFIAAVLSQRFTGSVFTSPQVLNMFHLFSSPSVFRSLVSKHKQRRFYFSKLFSVQTFATIHQALTQYTCCQLSCWPRPIPLRSTKLTTSFITEILAQSKFATYHTVSWKFPCRAPCLYKRGQPALVLENYSSCVLPNTLGNQVTARSFVYICV